MLHLHTLWFIVIAILWVGFFVLEGFDFGVGMLQMLVGRTEPERELVVRTIGPWWDGNEVWLIVAAAGMFAAFPLWYATMFSALYLAFLAVLVALMARGVALEFTTKSDDPAWRRRWRWALTGGSLLIPLLIGIGLGDLLHGLPVNSQHDYSGGLADLVTGYGLWTGATLVALCLLHGITFIKLRTIGVTRAGAQSLARGRMVGDRACRRVRDLDAHPQRPRRARTGADPRSDSGRRRGTAERQRSRRMGFCGLGRRGRRRRRVAVHRAVSQRDGVEHEQRVQPDRQQRSIRRLRAEGDDGRDGAPLPGRAALPGLVRPRLSRARDRLAAPPESTPVSTAPTASEA